MQAIVGKYERGYPKKQKKLEQEHLNRSATGTTDTKDKEVLASN